MKIGVISDTHNFLDPQIPELFEGVSHRLITSKRPDVVVFGHTHRRFCETIGGVLYLNPGYAGKPKYGLERSAVILHCSGKEIRVEYFKL